KATVAGDPASEGRQRPLIPVTEPSSVHVATELVSDEKPSASASASGPQAKPLEQFEKKSTVRNFEKALNYLWFTQGKIHETKELIEANPKLVEKLGDVPKSLSNRVLGEA